MLPDAPYHYACDGKWWDHHYKAVKAGFSGQSYTINDLEHPERNPKSEYELNRYNSTYGDGLGEKSLHYGAAGGGNSGFQAVNLAYLLGAKTIILLGFDMFGTHYFGKHPGNLDVSSPFKSFMHSFELIDTEKHGIEIINCTRSTALTCFPKMSLESALSSEPAQA